MADVGPKDHVLPGGGGLAPADLWRELLESFLFFKIGIARI